MDQIILNVSQLNDYAKEVLNRDPLLKNVLVRGEIGSFKNHFPSNHWYFSLKDEKGKVDCVMFRSNTASVRFSPVIGDRVVITGYVDIYPPNGQYRLMALTMKRDGAGDLNAEFERLKARLYAEGLFDAAVKKPLPLVPRKIAVLTSESGAVWHDIINVANMRNPSVAIMLIPVPVQGEGAAGKIAQALDRASDLKGIDVIIVGRGGGSMEDLWPFNEEILARAVARCKIPVISAVGHETDFTICDMVADVRASTPSNAAEIAVPTTEELKLMSSKVREQLYGAFDRNFRKRQLAIASMRLRVERRDPFYLFKAAEEKIKNLKKQYDLLGEAVLTQHRSQLNELRVQLQDSIGKKVDLYAGRTEMLKSKLEALSPLNVLNRGYVIVTTGKGHIVTRKKEASEEKNLLLMFGDGTVQVKCVEEPQ